MGQIGKSVLELKACYSTGKGVVRQVVLMTGHGFGSGILCPEEEIAKEGADSNSKHHPAIICHKKEPERRSSAR